MRKILVIDDRTGNLTSIRAALEDSIPDCHVIEARLGKEGIEVAREEQPQVILLDVVMPEMDGFETCKRLKTHEQTRHIHVILISAFENDTKNKVKGFSAGADAFLIRPIEKAELAAQISAMLRITETEQRLKSALRKAEESDRLKEAFLASISHEFRTPLNAIIGFSGLLTCEATPDDVVHYGKTIHEKGFHLLKLVEDLFEITLILAGEVQIANKDVEIRPLLFDMVQIAKKEKLHQERERVELLLHPDMEACELKLQSDPARIKQILANLVNNAMKFTKEGTVEIGCRKEIWTGKQYVTFYVKDSGVGISQKHLDIIFDLFRQADDTYSRPFQGAGVGLFIAKKLTDLLGGVLWVESQEGSGSTFFLTLPLSVQFRNPESEKMDSLNFRRKVG